MIKSELIQIIASRNPHLYATDVARVIDAILDDITHTLEQGGRVEMRGFGTFSVRHRRPKAGRNPRNGEAVDIVEKWVPMFKAGKEMRERLNNKPIPSDVSSSEG